VISESCVGLESFTRDPIGYLGSKYSLYEYCKANPQKRIDPTGLRSSWWNWYYGGNGVAHDLSEDWGLYHDWLNSPVTASALRAFKSALSGSASCGECGETATTPFTKNFPVDYAPGNYQIWRNLFPIGNTTLVGSGSCTMSTTCSDKKIGEEPTECNKTASYYKRTICCSGSCQGTLTLSDAFVDAADAADLFSGNQEFPGGVGYSFTASTTFKIEIKESCSDEILYDPFN